jgi:hypothetical protein
VRKALAAVLLVVLASCGQSALKQTATQPSPKAFQPPSTWTLFLTSDQSVQHSYSRTALDATTLKDAGTPISGHGYASASADGSTLVEVDYKPDAASSITITNARTGAIRTSFQSSVANGPTLTADGSRLLTFDTMGHSYRVFDTSTGRVTGSLETSDSPCCNLFGEWLDPTGNYLYAILVPGSGYNATGPVTPVLVRYDLHVGRENARLKLTGVQAGVWRNGQILGSEPETTILQPGAAMSPDGSQLAVLYNGGSRLMTIDAIGMKITATRSVVVPSVSSSRFGVAPVDADAKAEVGTIWSATYSPDGRQLMASEHEMTIDPKSQVSTSHGLGVRIIDMQSATVLADRRGIDIGQAVYAPDSTALFATTWSDDNAGLHNTVVMRLDPSNLATAARREFTGFRWLLLLAR